VDTVIMQPAVQRSRLGQASAHLSTIRGDQRISGTATPVPGSFRQEAIAPIQNKVGRLLSNAPIRNIVGQVAPKVDFRFMMDHGHIFIANLAKARTGEDKANLLGSLLGIGPMCGGRNG
jgi:hypothetical protein